MRALSSAIQDLDNQIEEQKLKIQNTVNASLRVSVLEGGLCVTDWWIVFGCRRGLRYF